MIKIRILNWKSGFNKVEFNKMLRQEFGHNIAEAKQIVDDILENNEVYLVYENIEEAESKLRYFQLEFIVENK